MLAALGAIVDALSTFLNLIVSFFNGLLSLFALIPSGMAFIGQCVAVMPSVLVVFVTAGIGVVVVLHILGR